jgi:transcriptional regulator with XRE-family HTH domain
MPNRCRTRLAADAARANRDQALQLGTAARAARLRRQLTQDSLGRRVGLSQASISRAERGLGAGLTLDAWQRLALALGIGLYVALRRDPMDDTLDAAHLALQELVLTTTKAAGYRASVELPSRPIDPRRSVDVALVDDQRRRFLIVECWNTFGDVGAALRSTSRKQVDAEALAAARWGEVPFVVAVVWVVRATARNRALVGRYPELFATRFPGSSARWLQALSSGTPPPAMPGLVWASVDAARLYTWRRRPTANAHSI